MDLRKAITLMAIEAATFEDESTSHIQLVALGTLYARNWRMLAKRSKVRRGIRTDKKVHFLLTATPRQDQ